MGLKVAIASDHGGFQLKEFLKDNLDIKWIDLGTDSEKAADHPEYGHKLSRFVAEGGAEFGVAICGTGIGISIACNRHPEIRAAVCTDSTMARLTREHNDANVLCLGARIIGEEVALDVVQTFLETEFNTKKAKYARRVEMYNDFN